MYLVCSYVSGITVTFYVWPKLALAARFIAVSIRHRKVNIESTLGNAEVHNQGSHCSFILLIKVDTGLVVPNTKEKRRIKKNRRQYQQYNCTKRKELHSHAPLQERLDCRGPRDPIQKK